MPSYQALGFRSYQAYLNSSHWLDTKRRYRESDRPQDCILCGADEDLHLHHMTYARLGCEKLTDLVTLCARCHAMAHVLIRRGDATLRLDGLTDAERAAAYREQTADLLRRASEEKTATRRVSLLDKGELTMLNKLVERRSKSLNAQAARRRREIGNTAFRAERKMRRRAAKARDAAHHNAAENYAERSFSPDD
jgi:hypothetical protein